jgi:hypothetical protein
MESTPVRRSTWRWYQLLLRAMLFGLLCGAPIAPVIAQEPVGASVEPLKSPVSSTEDLSPAPAKVDVKPVARDEEIRKRLQRVLNATGWFTDPHVRVEEGVVFLNGQTETDELKKWAGDLARNTQDVVAVINRIEVAEPSAWDFRPAWSGMLILWRDTGRCARCDAGKTTLDGTAARRSRRGVHESGGRVIQRGRRH